MYASCQSNLGGNILILELGYLIDSNDTVWRTLTNLGIKLIVDKLSSGNGGEEKTNSISYFYLYFSYKYYYLKFISFLLFINTFGINVTHELFFCTAPNIDN